MAGIIAELGKSAASSDFRRISANEFRVLLIESDDRLLRTFPVKLNSYASKALQELGVEVVTGAPVAKQQGRFVARCLKNELSGRATPGKFRYRDFRMLATIGRGRAVADFGRISTKGWLTWWFWGLCHIYFLIGRQSRLLVALKWLFEYLTFQRSSRLIVK